MTKFSELLVGILIVAALPACQSAEGLRINIELARAGAPSISLELAVPLEGMATPRSLSRAK